MPARPITRDALGTAVRELRLARQLSQETLAETARIHVTYLSGIERGHRNPSLGVLNALAAALDIPTRDLLERADGPEA